MIIFSVCLWYLIKNQKDCLVGIETEIDLKDRVLQKTSGVYEKIKAENVNKAPFSALMVRIKNQKTIFTVVQWVTVIATIVTYMIYLFITVFPY